MSEILSHTDTAVYFGIAALATLLFLIRLAMMLLGGELGDHGGDFSTDVGGDTDFSAHDAHPDSTGVFKVFSLVSVVAFFMGAGWMGLISRYSWQFSGPVTGLLAIAFGSAVMLLTAYLSLWIRRLNETPTYDPRSCVGTVGRAYLTVPARGAGRGQVQVVVQGRQRILMASSSGPEIPAFTSVRVVSVEHDNSLVVEPQGGPPAPPA